MDQYILNENGEPVRCKNLMEFAKWFATAERQVAFEMIGESSVSTVFLGLDHSFGSKSNPILWETMVFDGPLDMAQDRCSGSREQAEAMHARMVARVNESLAESHE